SDPRAPPSFPTRRSSDLGVALDDPLRNWRVNAARNEHRLHACLNVLVSVTKCVSGRSAAGSDDVAISAEAEAHTDLAGNRSHGRSEEHTSELQSPCNLVC